MNQTLIDQIDTQIESSLPCFSLVPGIFEDYFKKDDLVFCLHGQEHWNQSFCFLYLILCAEGVK